MGGPDLAGRTDKEEEEEEGQQAERGRAMMMWGGKDDGWGERVRGMEREEDMVRWGWLYKIGRAHV